MIRRRASTTPPTKAILYSRRGCHLCDVAHRKLLAAGLTVQVVDIDGDCELQQRYTDCVPVVEIEGKERFRGHISDVLLRRLLRGGS